MAKKWKYDRGPFFEAMAQGYTIKEAAVFASIPYDYANALWQRLKKQYGEQAK